MAMHRRHAGHSAYPSRQPPHYHARDIEVVKLDKRRESIGTEGVGELGYGGRIGADVFALYRQHVNWAVSSTSCPRRITQIRPSQVVASSWTTGITG